MPNQHITALLEANDGELPKWAWPGGYPFYYLDRQGNVLCPDCANREVDESQEVVASDVNYEDAYLYCDDCGERVESAYSEDVHEDNRRAETVDTGEEE